MKFLVADDDRVACCVLQDLLEKSDHEVVIANDGQQAWDILQSEDPPQIAILDWMMPEIDGIELCKKLRQSEEGRKLYLILLTGNEKESQLVTGFEAGADDYIIKPFRPGHLNARLQPALRIADLHHQLDCETETLFNLTEELLASNQRLELAALTDVLTDLPNRRSLIERLLQEWSAAERNDSALSSMMLDIDHFKRINDSLGHDMGDQVLQSIAAIVRGAIRQNDIVCRYGGEEFVIVCPGSNLDETLLGAERIRKIVESESTVALKYLKQPLTVSIGVAERCGATYDPDCLIKAADEALYAAKNAGRNRVCSLQHAESEPGTHVATMLR